MASASPCPHDSPAHSSACVQAGLRCEWDETYLARGTVTAVCNGSFWVVAERPSGCPAAPSGGGCGQFGRTCEYLVTGSYPAGGDASPAACFVRCDCYSGTWSCLNSCACPGTPDQDPQRTTLGTFEAGCLNENMRCEYRFNIGLRDDLPPELTTQSCRTTYTCRSSSWARTDDCACPTFGPQQRDVASGECHSEPSLECPFPAAIEGGPPQSCRCQDQLWTCR